MAVDLTQARSAAAAYLLGDPFTILRPLVLDDGAGGTSPDPDGPQRIGPFLGAFRALSGDELAPSLAAARGHYRLKTTIDLVDPDTGDPVTIAETDAIEVVGRVCQVAWTPPPANLSLFRIVGLEE